MKNLRKVLTPFAPDQSGAVSILYELGGIIVIIDAGGCAGNICGFDEPRWLSKRSAVFSAGLRDMDAIMGRDNALAKKIADAAAKIKANFIALIGTPVPAVIATDYKALKRKIETETKLPVLSINTNGMDLYDKGAQKALYALYGQFSKEQYALTPGRVNIIGACPLDTGSFNPQVTLDDIKTASAAELNIAVSPSAVKCAKLLKERFKTPWKAEFFEGLPLLPDDGFKDKNILIVHQQVLANTLRDKLLGCGAKSAAAASYFMLEKDIKKEGDVSLRQEDDFTALANKGFDIIAADSALKPLAKNFTGMWIDIPHFALSGRMN